MTRARVGLLHFDRAAVALYGATMRAVVYRRFGAPEVLELTERADPIPRPDQVRVRIRATTVTAAESAMRQGLPLWGRAIIGFTRPRARFRTLGNELAGVIDAVGRDVTRFKEGDEVFGFAGFDIGANADFLCLRESASLAPKPRSLDWGESAAAVDGTTTALFFLRDKARLREGQRVLIVGASGSVGTFAVQIAKLLGAHVTGVCSARNVDLVRSLGADDVVDYSTSDWTTLGRTWDVVFDTVDKSSFAHSKGSLTDRGTFLPTAVSPGSVVHEPWTRLLGGKRLISGMSVEKSDALRYLREHLDDGRLRVVVDRRWPLEEVVEAHRLVDTGHKRGNVILDVSA
jgi:NADPH2:quinone reductase